VFSVLTTNEKSHDPASCSTARAAGRVNHYAFWVDTREEPLTAGDAHGERLPDRIRPSIHGIGEQNFLYYREPSSLRIELNTGGYRNYVPDREPNTWRPSQGSNNFYRNSAMPMSMTELFLPADGLSATEEGVPDEIKEALFNPYAKHGQG
jgi:catechol 2,3-dioxygenase